MLMDTHAWIWMIEDNPSLNASARRAILASAADFDLYLSPISLWEIALKASRGKLTLDLPLRAWLGRGMALTRIQLAQITPDIACACAELPKEFHGDPADRLIAATAREEGMTLMTHDRSLLTLSKRGYFKAFAI